MEIEFGLRKTPFVSKPHLSLYFKTITLKKHYEPDFMVFEDIVVEIKAQKILTKNDEAQIINSLKSSRDEIGLLINFGEPSLKFRRFIYSK